MPIAVICPGCRAQFRVSEKFAGKQGACPKCKAMITVPLADEIKIHVPDEVATPDGKGKLGTPDVKPVTRKKTRVQPVMIAAMAGAVVLVIGITWVAGEYVRSLTVLRYVGTALLSLPLAMAAYSILRDDELEPYRGAQLWIRASICAAVYAALWAGFAFVPGYLFANNWNWLFIAPPFLLIGGLAAFSCFDLAPESAFFHYTFYLLATLLLRAAAGMPALWNLAPPPSLG